MAMDGYLREHESHIFLARCVYLSVLMHGARGVVVGYETVLEAL